MSRKPFLINQNLKGAFPEAVQGEGIYLFDSNGNKYLDGCAGALVANLGHQVPEISRAMAEQAEKLPYVYRYHFSNPVAEELAERFCRLTDKPMGRAYFVNSGSEASETAVKLARARALAAGEKDRHKIISRWQSYHGVTMGALSWSGFTARRADYQPYLKDFVHIAPAYCYRCWFGRTPENCGLECARALETAVMTQGPETVLAFLAEPVAGSALAAARPPDEYFRVIREICDRYGILYLAEEVMTGAGRTGGKYFASDHFPGDPDFIVFGKGVGAGYYPLGGVLIDSQTTEILMAGQGSFAAGQSHSGHPIGMAAGLAALDLTENLGLPAHAAQMGEILGRELDKLRSHPTVGDVRGMGLMWGLEFVRNRETRETFDPAEAYYNQVYQAAREAGLLILPASGCDRGQAGDMALLGPPLTINEEQISEMVGLLDEALIRVEKKNGF